MTCQRCGAEVPSHLTRCRNCELGFAAFAPKPASRPRGTGAKVIPFRPRRLKKQRGKRSFRPDRVWWWLISILILSLVLPYVLPWRG
ncbi:MAG: hypothetical protein K6U14_02325 [Firmicutes bacterium]|nr:hypothetical protein [Alicyclobacillaceae bacterium]MCL6496457.1 hypothetical protein [Bacillota bacterium]